MGVIVLAALMAGTVVSTWQAIRATRATHAERVALTKARESEAAAKQSEQVAIENAKKAQRQRDRANRYFLGARSVVDGITERLNDSRLLQIPEITDMRKQLLQDLLGFYQQMVQNESVDPAGAQDKAGALRMVGDIQQILRDRAAAEMAYRQAIAIREPYVAQHPDEGAVGSARGGAKVPEHAHIGRVAVSREIRLTQVLPNDIGGLVGGGVIADHDFDDVAPRTCGVDKPREAVAQPL